MEEKRTKFIGDVYFCVLSWHRPILCTAKTHITSPIKRSDVCFENIQFGGIYTYFVQRVHLLSGARDATKSCTKQLVTFCKTATFLDCIIACLTCVSLLLGCMCCSLFAFVCLFVLFAASLESSIKKEDSRRKFENNF